MKAQYIAVLGLFVLMALPFSGVEAKTKVTVSGNGAYAKSLVNVKKTTKSSLKQNNDLLAVTAITLKGKTGYNTVNGATGTGSIDITTGNVDHTVNVIVSGNANTGTQPCGCDEDGKTVVDISGNGAHAYTKVTTENKTEVESTQKNTTVSETGVQATGETGSNGVIDPTGSEDISVNTGDVDGTIDVTVGGSTNTLE